MARLPALSALRALEATVRLGSVREAARSLNVTDGAVSRAIRELEADLGHELFIREHRRIIPTARAQVLAADVRASIDALSAGLARARGRRSDSHSLTISCEPTLLMRWLIPRLGDLQAVLGSEALPRLVAAGGPVDFERADIDLALRRADFPVGAEYLSEPFFQELIGPVLRPLAERPRRSKGVTGVLLHTATRPDAWEIWSGRSRVPISPSREQTFEHFYLTLQAAAAGFGTAIGPLALVVDDLTSGALIAPWGFVPDGSQYVLLAPRAKIDSDLYHRILEWLRSSAPSNSIPGRLAPPGD